MNLVDGVLVWRSGLAVDADGSPRAYHPDSSKGLDYLANAGKPGRWWGLACDDKGVPYVQGSGDPAPDFFVSTTSLFDPLYLAKDPRRYVNSEAVCYITATSDMIRQGVRMGDCAVVLYDGKTVAAVVADKGPHPGEGSIALCQALGVPSDPRHGGVSAPVVSFAVFPGSAPRPCWPRDFSADALSRFAAWGAPDRLAASIPTTSPTS